MICRVVCMTLKCESSRRDTRKETKELKLERRAEISDTSSRIPLRVSSAFVRLCQSPGSLIACMTSWGRKCMLVGERSCTAVGKEGSELFSFDGSDI